MRNACNLDTHCGLACDASARDAKLLTMWVERCEPLSLRIGSAERGWFHRGSLTNLPSRGFVVSMVLAVGAYVSWFLSSKRIVQNHVKSWQIMQNHAPENG